jgi:hypothetical protein
VGHFFNKITDLFLDVNPKSDAMNVRVYARQKGASVRRFPALSP